MVVNCEHVWQEVSNYVDGEIDPSLRQAIEEHVRGCRQCTAVLDGTRNVVRLYGDDRFVELPVGFSQRLQHKLQTQATIKPGRARVWSTWAMAAAAVLLLVAGLWVGRTGKQNSADKTKHTQPYTNIPPDLLVAVAGNAREFHLPDCDVLIGKTDIRTMKASEAMQQGLAPCPRCLKKYLTMLHGGHVQANFPNAGEAEEPPKKLPSGV